MLKQDGAVLVVGANFVAYGESWERQNKHIESALATLFGARERGRLFAAQWAPTRTTSIVATALRKHFESVEVVNDLAEAKAKRAKWIVMFDHSFEPSPGTPSWTNTTAIDFLNANGLRIFSATFSEHKSYAISWFGENDESIRRNLGDDVLRSVNNAVIQFDAKLAAISQ